MKLIFRKFLTTGDLLLDQNHSYQLLTRTFNSAINCHPSMRSDNKKFDVTNNAKTYNGSMEKNCRRDLGYLEFSKLHRRSRQETSDYSSLRKQWILNFLTNKKTFSIVLLALVDAHYRFIAVDVGGYGKNSDESLFANFTLGKALEKNKLNVPKDNTLPNTQNVMSQLAMRHFH